MVSSARVMGVPLRFSGSEARLPPTRKSVFWISSVHAAISGSLQTLRANVDYGLAEARTTYGTIGVKVWIFKGEVLQRKARRIPE